MNKSILLLTAFLPMAFPALGQEKPDPPNTSIWTAASRGSVTLIEQHIAAGTAIDARKDDTKGQTPLYYAAKLDRAESVRVLLDAGADPNKTVSRDYFAREYHQDTTLFPPPQSRVRGGASPAN